MQKIGILVVYLLDETNKALFDLHYSKISEFTQNQFQIYAGAVRTEDKSLLDKDRLAICKLDRTPEKGFKEHAFYLEQLIQIAFKDGCTHVAIFHMDSFPVKVWDVSCIEHLKNTKLVAIRRDEELDYKPHTSFIFFGRDWYDLFPQLLLEEEIKQTEEYQQYLKDSPHCCDSGWGYGFKIYKEKIAWKPLIRSNRGEDHYLAGSVYEDMIFHLGGITRKDLFFRKQRLDDWRKAKDPLLREAQVEANKKALHEVKGRLLNDTVNYLNYLRFGS
tara:strand:+ start:124 stop:945 length:822 start_codon:yes stop_codon:yes gene_type:complete